MVLTNSMLGRTSAQIRKWISWTGQSLLWIFSAWLLLWNLLRIWPGERLWPIAITNYLAPWMMIAAFPVGISAFLYKKYILGLAASIAAVSILFRLFPLITNPHQDLSTIASLSVLTFNLHDRNMDIESTISLIGNADADIVALQEMIPSFREPMLDGLKGLYPYHTLTSSELAKGQGLLSKYPLTYIERSLDRRVMSANVEFPEGDILLVNVHTPSTFWPFNWDEKRSAQRYFLDSVLDGIADAQLPVILLGDFNVTTLSENYALIRQDFRDSFMDSGRGFGFTYPTGEKFGIKLPTPMVRIDYIFHNNYLASLETKTLRDNSGSDHRPVLARLRFGIHSLRADQGLFGGLISETSIR